METIFLALRVLLSLAVVLVAIWYAHRKLSKGGRIPRATKTVNVVAKQSVGAKASVVVMDVDGQRFLLGVTEQAVTVLNTSATPSAEAAPQLAAAPRLPAPNPAVPGLPARTTGEGSARPSGGAAFARVLSEVQTTSAEHVEPAPVVYLPEQQPSVLEGSILSPATWRRTAAALRRTP